MTSLILFACTTPTPVSDSTTSTEEEPEQPYACGWQRADPGDLVATGAEVGEVMGDLVGTDQCGEEYHVWDGHGGYQLLLAPVFW